MFTLLIRFSINWNSGDNTDEKLVMRSVIMNVCLLSVVKLFGKKATSGKEYENRNQYPTHLEDIQY